MNDLRHLKVGDPLFVVRRRDRNRQGSADEIVETVVTKVGRDYLHATVHGWDGCRFRRDTGLEVSGYQPRTAYADRDAYEASERRDRRIADTSTKLDRARFGSLRNLTDAELDALNAMLDTALKTKENG